MTSANLTGLGLDENIELGLLVRGGPTPRRIARYVRGLMAEGVLAGRDLQPARRRQAHAAGRAPITLVPVTDEERIAELANFAESYSDEALGIKKALVSLDENQEGEPVSRILLLLADPTGDTWEVDDIRELRQTLGRKATDLELPPVTLTLVAESEREAIDAFAQ
ncbi:MAG: hypothetical protein ACRDLD_07670 [Thermoleophilaceae bacterium]